MTATNHAHVRASCVCPLCKGAKDVGLVACWECYRLHDLRNGNARAEQTIAAADLKLATPAPVQMTLL